MARAKATEFCQLRPDVMLYPGDCLDALRCLDDNSVDSCVTDPPYGLSFMGKHWDHGVPGADYWREVLRVLKPGAHLLSFGGTRTYHRMASAIEDAGFEIRDCVQWLYGSGFPKSLNVSKAIDKAAGAKRPVLGQYIAPDGNPRGIDRGIQGGNFASGKADYVAEKLVTGPATESAREWEGFGTALKPACEPIVLARKPLSESTVTANVLKWGTGALNIDGCRVAVDPIADASQLRTMSRNVREGGDGWGMSTINGDIPQVVRPDGRWPANVIHDGSDEVVAAFPLSTVSGSAKNGRSAKANEDRVGVTSFNAKKGNGTLHNDSGSAARFFYCAKASKADRAGSKHPTVKPIKLLRYLARLVTPPGGTIIDVFAGTGTLATAALQEGFSVILCEKELEYVEDIRRRVESLRALDDTDFLGL